MGSEGSGTGVRQGAAAEAAPRVSVVVIGLNEERRLARALESVRASRLHESHELIYVDSGSTDSSPSIARGFADVRVETVRHPRPTAAVARNTGLSVARGPFVQFLDGDSALDPSWLAGALEVLRADPALACVFGRLQEVGAQRNLYARMCEFDWHMGFGEVRTCGGNALWRREVLDHVGFFDESLGAGEEPDLCYRVRAAGYRIVSLDRPMAEHDLEMDSFAAYWSRAVRSGGAYARIAVRYARAREKLWLHETLRNFAEPGIWIGLLASSALAGPPGAALALWLTLRTSALTWKLSKEARSVPQALLYAFHLQLVRLPYAWGQLRALAQLARNATASR